MIKELVVICSFLGIFYSTHAEDCPEIVKRKQWDARRPVAIEYAIIPVPNVIVHHTVTPQCTTFDDCKSRLKTIQDFHLDQLDFHDIGYNFLVGGDGKIYEGAGWHKVAAHTRGYNSRSLGLAFIGDYSNVRPNRKMLEAAKSFLKCAVQMGELAEDYKLMGAKQVSATASPGVYLYREIQKWNNYFVYP